jgi:hypothetical protein
MLFGQALLTVIFVTRQLQLVMRRGSALNAMWLIVQVVSVNFTRSVVLWQSTAYDQLSHVAALPLMILEWPTVVITAQN